MRVITNILIPQPWTNLSQENLWTISLDDQDIIRSIQPMIDLETDSENWRRDWLSPMGIDLQINGGLGLTFNNLCPEQLPRLY